MMLAELTICCKMSKVSLQMPRSKVVLASFVGSEEQAPTVEIYLDPLCPACGQVDRILNDTLEKMYEEGQIKIEIHPLNFFGWKIDGHLLE